MSAPRLAVLTAGGGGSARLAAAALGHPGVGARVADAGDPRLDGVAGVVLDAPPATRAALLTAVLARCRAPILVEFPAAPTAAGLRQLPGRDRVVSLNPLRHALPTRRLRDALLATHDPLETVFAAWRFRPDAWHHDALAQLLDYLAALGPGRPARVSAARRGRPDVLLGLLRYDGGVVGSIEVGAHLPHTVCASQELVVECFCRESVHHCWPGNQAVRVEGREPLARDWSPDAAEHMVTVFVDALLGRPVPEGFATDDAAALALAETLQATGAASLS